MPPPPPSPPHDSPEPAAPPAAPPARHGDPLPTPPTPRAAEHEHLTVHDDYFAPPPPLPPRPALGESAPSQLFSLQGSAGPTTPAAALQAKATIAISLPEGVHAHQQDGVRNDSGSAVSAPSYCDSTSVRSLVPTINTRDNDVESMLGEILGEGRYAESASVSVSETSVAEDDSYDESPEWPASDEEQSYSEEELLARWRSLRKHFFILSAAGKPIYSRHGNEALLSGYMGVIQALISFFADDNDNLTSFTSGRTNFVVAALGPLYLVAISSLPESTAQLRAQLEALYTQILSTLTLTQLTRVFTARGQNFDLRRLLGGTEVFLDGLCDSMSSGSPQVLLSALECVKIRKSQRESINQVLLKHRDPSLLYGLIVADSRLVSVIRPKRHSLHPPDLLLIFSMLFNASTFSDGGEHWSPVCLPKFNAKGFLHAYICFFRPEVAMVLISADKDAFFALRAMKEAVVASLDKAGLSSLLYSDRVAVRDIQPAASPIRHFVYKSRQNVQFAMSSLKDISGYCERRRLWDVYHRLHADVHRKNAHLRVGFLVGTRETALSWVAPGFELYLIAHPNAGRRQLAKGAEDIVKWVRSQEERLFVIGGATF